MEFSQVVQARKSVRKFTQDPVPDSVIEKALEDAILAPNSSNMQTWDFYWVTTKEKKDALIQYCLNQSAARTAAHLVVVVANPKLWKRSQPHMVEFTKRVNAPSLVKTYYEKLIPVTYSAGPLSLFALFKWPITTITGLFRPMPRGPYSNGDLQEIAIKSAALASENFVLSISNQGFDTCMMEGFDECRVKKLLQLPCLARVVMVIAVGKGSEKGTWGPRFRLPSQEVIHRV